MLCTPHHAPFPLCHTADTLELSVIVQTDETNCHLFDLAGSTLPCMLHTVCYTNTCTHAVTHMFCVKITASLHDYDTWIQLTESFRLRIHHQIQSSWISMWCHTLNHFSWAFSWPLTLGMARFKGENKTLCVCLVFSGLFLLSLLTLLLPCTQNHHWHHSYNRWGAVDDSWMHLQKPPDRRGICTTFDLHESHFPAELANISPRVSVFISCEQN